MSQDDQVVVAVNRLVEQVEVLNATIRSAADTIAEAIRQRPGAHEDMSAQGAVS